MLSDICIVDIMSGIGSTAVCVKFVRNIERVSRLMSVAAF